MRPATAPIGLSRAPATDQSPPPAPPGEHFAAALAFHVAGAAALVVVAPDLAAGAFYLPRVAATVHLFTLGWIMLSIFGALCQFLPVAVGRPVRWPALAHVTFALQAAGTAALAGALVPGHRALLYAGAAALSGAFVLRLFIRHATAENERGNMSAPELDVGVIPPREKHPAIFRAFDGLQPGEAFVLVNDHDPFPLRHQFEALRAGRFAWNYEERGPAV